MYKSYKYFCLNAKLPATTCVGFQSYGIENYLGELRNFENVVLVDLSFRSRSTLIRDK